jgi:hypothetical protein
MLRRVDLERRVMGETLQAACLEAAKECKYQAKVQDNEEHCELRDTTVQRDYESTDILVGNLFPALLVSGIRRNNVQRYFYIRTGFPFGRATEDQVTAYLLAVSNHLP